MSDQTFKICPNCGGHHPITACSYALTSSSLAAMPGSVYGIIDPDYARVFTHARIIAWQFGYACLAHGSFTRDLDLLLVPWTENARVPIDALINRIADVAGLKLQGPPSEKPHGRKAWSLLFPAFNDPRWVDVSAFTPNDGAETRHTKT